MWTNDGRPKSSLTDVSGRSSHSFGEEPEPWYGNLKQVRPRNKRVYEDNNIICNLEYMPEVDLFRTLSTQVRIWLEQKGGNSVALTSCTAGEGKTFTSINLAISLARSGFYKVILIDADLRRPNVARSLGLALEYGLDDVLSQRADLEDCLIATEIEGLLLLPTRQALRPSSPLLSGFQQSKLVKDIHSVYRDYLLVYDLPPILLGDSCAPYLIAADGCIVLAQEGHARRAHLKRALSLINHEKLIGVTLNKTSQSIAKQYGYYTYDDYVRATEE